MKVNIIIPNEKGVQEEKNFEVDVKNGTTVLQVLETIFQRNDPTLAFRYSCKIGLCGTCSVMINGKAGLSCMEQAESKDNGILQIEPMPRGKMIRGLTKEV